MHETTIVEETAAQDIADPVTLYRPHAEVPSLLTHTRREQWGLGIILSREDDRVHLQWQDGRKRTFKAGYYHLLDAVDRRLDVALGIVDALRAMAGAKPRSSAANRPVSLDEQVAYFGEVLFTDGFRGDEFTSQFRGDGRKRALKRHRDALVELAQQKLAKRPLLKALSQGDPSEVHARAVEVVACTDLVKVTERKRFMAMPEAHHAALANALFAVLHGKAELSKSFGGLVAALERGMGETPSWELSTIFLGALRPTEHCVIRTNTHGRQAMFMAPGLTLPDRPMGSLYVRLLGMSASVREQLLEEELEPRDYFDVLDFMWQTLRPTAQKAIRERAANATKTVAPKVERAAA